MRAYVWALLAQTQRKNGWTLARAAGDAGPERMQRLLNLYPWDSDGVRDDLRAVVVEALGDARNGVLIVGETAFPKKGRQSAGVARRFSDTLGRMENVQIGVFLAYASRRGQALIDRELYLPKEWTSDRDRCRSAGIPDDVAYAPKPVLARRMIARAARAKVPFGWVTGDATYGHDTGLRMWLQAEDIAYVLEIPAGDVLESPPPPKGKAPVPQPPAWVPVALAEKESQRYDWAVIGVRAPRPKRRQWLLARRDRGDPADITCYVGVGPADTSIAELARVAGSRKAIDECLRTARSDAGLGGYKARGYQAWYRHVTLSMAAAGYLMVTRSAH